MVSILLTTATTGGSSDTFTLEIANGGGYGFAGIDATAIRTNSRAGYAYYEGIPIPLESSYQRRLVVVNMLAGSPSHQQYEILFSESGGNPDAATAKAAIDAVQAAPAGTTYEAWKMTQGFAANQDGPEDDPDRDGWCNLLEYYGETNPLSGSSRPTSILTRTPTGFTYTYRRAMDRISVTHTLQAGPLDALSTYTPSGESVLGIAPNIEEVTVPLSPGFGPFLRQAIALDP